MGKEMSNSKDNTYTGFRPRVANEEDYFFIKKWCDLPQVKRSFSSVLNSLIPMVRVACEQTTRTEQGEVSIELNLGRIIIRK